MIKQDLAPVLVVTYARLEHLKRTISALSSNYLAYQTDLYVASDCARTKTDAEYVAAVRRYLKQVDGFKSVTVFEREQNLGAAANTFSALEVILKLHDRFILMEDDIVTAPAYLTFINEAFKRYDGNQRVFSISGYCPPISIPNNYAFDAFFLGRMNAWGCALTRDSYLAVPRYITREEYDAIAADVKSRNRLINGGGEDIMTMLKKVAEGSLDAWDVRCMYTQFKLRQVTVYPTESLVQNIGFDGTGTHCGKSDKFDVTLSDKTKFSFPDKIAVDRRILKEYLKFRNTDVSWLRPWYVRLPGRIAGKLWRLGKAPNRLLGD
jgi:hypothetical protein